MIQLSKVKQDTFLKKIFSEFLNVFVNISRMVHGPGEDPRNVYN